MPRYRQTANQGRPGSEEREKIERIRRKLEEENEAIADLEHLHDKVTKYWYNIKLQRNIGHVEHAPAIKIDEGRTQYTADWAVFSAAEAKAKDAFEGKRRSSWI